MAQTHVSRNLPTVEQSLPYMFEVTLYSVRGHMRTLIHIHKRMQKHFYSAPMTYSVFHL